MKFSIDKKSQKPILGVILVGTLLGATILFWNKGESGKEHAKPVAAASAEQGKQEGKKQEDHKEEEGLVPMTEAQIKSAGITLAKAGPATLGTIDQLPGEVKFNEDRTAHVVPRIAGVAESVQADLGQRVKKGQVLAIIASPELAEMRSAHLAAQKRLALAQLTAEREKKLWQDKISAEQDYLQARQASQEAEIQAQNAKSKLTAIGADVSDGALNRYVIRAPFDGVVVEKHITQGEAIKEDTNVFLLSDLSTVWVEVVVAAKDIEAVRVGSNVEIKSSSTSSSATGKVSYVGNLLGEQTRTAKARVVIDNPNMAWRPGLFVNIALVRGKTEVPVAVASDAIQTLEGRTVVFTKVAEGFQAKEVRTGRSEGGMVEIVEGLAPGSSYVATGSYVVKAEQGKGSAEHGH